MRFPRQSAAASVQTLALAILLFGAPAGSKIVPQKEATSSELLVIVQDGKYGYIDHQGNIVIRPQFIYGEYFSQGMATVLICGRFVSIDSEGNVHPFRIALPGELVPKRA